MMGKKLAVLELGLPYTKWNVELGDTTFNCFNPLQSTSESVWGQKIRLGIIYEKGSDGLYFTYERYDGDLLSVDVFGLQYSHSF